MEHVDTKDCANCTHGAHRGETCSRFVVKPDSRGLPVPCDCTQYVSSVDAAAMRAVDVIKAKAKALGVDISTAAAFNVLLAARGRAKLWYRKARRAGGSPTDKAIQGTLVTIMEQIVRELATASAAPLDSEPAPDGI